MMRELYADNYDQRRLETLLRAEGRCEHILADGTRCPHRLGTFKISHAYNPYFEQLIIHHPHNDPENPEAVMIAVCASCHMKLHRPPDAHGHIPARKQGYAVVSITHLRTCLARVGFHTHHTEECRIAWHFRPCALEGEAAATLDALTLCLHWLGGEVHDLQETLAHAQADNLRLTDHLIRTQHAEERRLMDAALREHLCRSQRGEARI